MSDPDKKRYVVRKYVMAKSVKEALELESSHMVDDVFLDEDWMKNNKEFASTTIGFSVEKRDEGQST